MRIGRKTFAVLNLCHPLGVNAGFVLTSDSILYIDASLTVPSARTIIGYSLAAAEAAGGNRRRPRWLVFTDQHSDHVFGMSILKRAGARTVGHVEVDRYLREELIPNFDNIVATFGLTPEHRAVLFAGVELSPLDEAVTTDRVLDVDGTEVHYLHTPGHTPGSGCVWVPEDRVLFAGDTLMSGYAPVTRFGNAELWRQWLASLEKLRNLDFDYIVPGHGPICGREEIVRHIGLLEQALSQGAGTM